MPDQLTYPKPIDPFCVGLLYGPDVFGGWWEMTATEVLPDGRGRATFRPRAITTEELADLTGGR